MGIHFPHVRTADLHRAGGHVPEAGYQAGCRGFTTAGRAYQRHRLSGFHPKGNVGQCRQFRPVIGKGNVFEFHGIILRVLRDGWNGQYRSAHHLIDPRKRVGGLHHTAGHEHNPRKRRGDNGGENRIKGKVRHKVREVSAFQGGRGNQQCRGNQEGERRLRKGQVRSLGLAARAAGEILRLFAVILDGLPEGPEGINRLLENLHHGNTPNVLRTGLADVILGFLVIRDHLRVLSAHHAGHGRDGNHCRQQARASHAPVENKHQHQHGNKHGYRADDIRQVMGQQRLCLRSRPVQAVPEQAGRIGIKKAQRRLHQVRHALFPDIACRAEGRQVGAHQRREIHQDAAHHGGKRQPAVPGNAGSPRPLRRHGNQVPHSQPDTEIRNHSQHHGRTGKPHTQPGQFPVAARVFQECRHIILLFPLF